MATYHWYGADSGNEGDFEVAANWYTPSGTVATEYPGENQTDHIVFDDRAANDLDTNTDQSANPNGIANITVKDGFSYAIGAASEPLILKLAGSPAWLFNGEDHGDLYLVGTTTAVASCHVIKTAESDDALHLVFADSAATAVRVSNGTVHFDALLGGQSSSGVATLIVAEQGTSTEATVILDAPIGTNLILHAGVVYWLGGTVTALTQYDGTFTAERAPAGPTLTDATFYGGTLKLETGGADLTITNAINVYGNTANVTWNPQQTISFT